MVNLEKVLREKVLQAVDEYYNYVFADEKPFSAGTRIPYAGRVFDEKEIRNLVDASLDFWLTTGRFAARFEEGLAQMLGVRFCSLTNSGSSANLLAFMALTSPQLGEMRILPGDEVITVAAGFPTTVAPIIQYGAVPVFVDIDIPLYNIDCQQLNKAISKKTKALCLAHTLGNPFNINEVKKFCQSNNLWLIEDNCDALGARFKLDGAWQFTGSIGDLATSSFYPPHHITTGEGGAVYSNNLTLKRLVESFRDWGRDCWCPSGTDNTCSKRFNRQFGELPFGYDHKYIYSHFGYNLKLTEMQAAIGCSQLGKLPDFVVARKKNWKILYDGLSDLDDYFIMPEATPNADPSWFGFLLTVKKDAGFTRDEIVSHLEGKFIQTRMLFAGNLLKHPCFDEMRNSREGYRVVGELKNTDIVMHQSFWVGVYPGLGEKQLTYMIDAIREFCRV